MMEDCSHSICYICKNVLPDYRAEIQKLKQEVEHWREARRRSQESAEQMLATMRTAIGNPNAGLQLACESILKLSDEVERLDSLNKLMSRELERSDREEE